MILFSIGFTKKTAQEFFEILKQNEIDCLVDIRLNPNGQLSRFAFGADLPYFLNRLVNGCKYEYRPDLAPKKELLKEIRTKGSAMSKDYKLFEKEFNNYLEKESNIENFIDQFNKYQNVVLLCSEPTPEKCHRRLVVEMLLRKFSDVIKFGGHL
jgi:uncharacterized protein YeaO (DUF488 family)